MTETCYRLTYQLQQVLPTSHPIFITMICVCARTTTATNICGNNNNNNNVYSELKYKSHVIMKRGVTVVDKSPPPHGSCRRQALAKCHCQDELIFALRIRRLLMRYF